MKEPGRGPRTAAFPLFAGAALCGSLLSFAAPVAAQERDAAAAEAMFLQGREAMTSGDYQTACPKFAESQRLDPAAGTLMNLATCEEKLGKLASAWQHWKEAIDDLPRDDNRVAFGRSRVTELEKRLSWLSVVLAPGTDPRAVVLRDSIELGKASQGASLPVDSGSHTITVLVPGRLAEKTTVSIAEAERKQIEVHEGAAAPPSATNDQGSHGARTLTWTLLGVGAAGVVTAVVTGVWLLNVKRSVDENCPNKTCVNQTGADAVATGKALIVANTGGYIVGAVGLGLGAYFFVSSSRQPSTTGLAPSVGPGQAGLSYAGTF
jgi:hypothetical protein